MPTNKLENLIVSIGGCHGTGCYDKSLKLKESLLKLFPNYTTKIINLDEMKDVNDLKYNDTDYDFESLLEELQKPIVFQDQNDKYSEPIGIIILCGGYALYDTKIKEITKLKVYLDSDADKRLINLIQMQNITQPDELSTLITEYLYNLREESLKHIEPTRVCADLILPSNNESLGTAILLDGINKAVEEMKISLYHTEKESQHPHSKKTSLLNFEVERIDLQKGRYYDLA